jgi:hypothetical protein
MSEEVTIEDPAALLKAHEKAKQDLVDLRVELKTLQKEHDELKTQSEALSPENLEKFKMKAIKAEIKAQLESEGIKNADRILKYMDFEGVDYDEEEKIVGVDDKLDVIKGDFPELFDPRKRAGRESVDIHANAPARAEKSTTESQVDQLFK